MHVGRSLAETSECWKLQFQAEVLFADNIAVFADDFPKRREEISELLLSKLNLIKNKSYYMNFGLYILI